MPNIDDLYSVYLKQLEAIIAESGLLAQKRNDSLNGEAKTSGNLCEQFIRETFEDFILPSQFRVTSGYIATPKLLRNKTNLPQCDILIIGNHLPTLLKLANSSIEVAPLELVAGVIEAKRTLTKSSLSDALDHINKIVDSIERKENLKTDTELTGYNRAVGMYNNSSNKPLLGIIAMTTDIKDFQRVTSEMITEKDSLIDFIWVLDGISLIPTVNLDSIAIPYTHTARPVTQTWTKISTSEFSGRKSKFYHMMQLNKTVWTEMGVNNGDTKERLFSKMIGYLSLTMSRIYCEPLSEEAIHDYFFKN